MRICKIDKSEMVWGRGGPVMPSLAGLKGIDYEKLKLPTAVVPSVPVTSNPTFAGQPSMPDRGNSGFPAVPVAVCGPIVVGIGAGLGSFGGTPGSIAGAVAGDVAKDQICPRISTSDGADNNSGYTYVSSSSGCSDA